MSYMAVSRRLASYLRAKTGASQEKEMVLAYATDIIIINSLNLSAILLIGFLLGILPATIAILATLFLFRHTAGGAHSDSPWRCAFITILSTTLMSLGAMFFPKYSQIGLDIIALLALLIGFTAIIKLAPVDNPAAPIVSPVRRKKLKIYSLLVFLLAAAITIILRDSVWEHAKVVQASLAFCLIWVSFMLTGPGHQLMNFIDRTFILRQGGEKNEGFG
ncbi:putative accessory gene regulator protein [Pelotomaculum schinkii]|uniref:Putative accessory gene regulator protein n=1 Tax=Pelotomaculum schinkii TaxID=78350 RepID=A0A4Y7RB12_9FIRM|nr:accessory gene regulator B family protein [Pelotomaculum schinkii]TEB05881.1 putative accessory gene regulator protein [Pelotomaculum schinkii]